jgi:CRP-like cAMP-binding protein
MKAPVQDLLNRIIAGLPPDEIAVLEPQLELVRLRRGTVLYEADAPLTHLYFPAGSVVSQMLLMTDGKTTELSMIGREGVVGAEFAMGSTHVYHRVEILGAGCAARIPAATLQASVARLPRLMHSLRLFSHVLMACSAQAAMCNRAHSIDEQICRWLLHAAERFPSSDLPVTQQTIALGIGVRREGISVALSKLRAEGAVEFSRGKIRILRHERIAARACECYGIVRREYGRLFPPLTSAAAPGEGLMRAMPAQPTPIIRGPVRQFVG